MLQSQCNRGTDLPKGAGALVLLWQLIQIDALSMHADMLNVNMYVKTISAHTIQVPQGQSNFCGLACLQMMCICRGELKDQT